ncbi:MAG: helix-turn-helix domain-containing protein [Lachnospiraceae bacterium]|nr:helix-turn-helix domain-containing protein [Lachnospiraceae bacterium]
MNINLNRKRLELDTVATGHKIKTIMAKKKVAIKDISKAMNVSFQAVYRWQKGETLPTISNLYILGQLLETDVDDMLVAKQTE